MGQQGVSVSEKDSTIGAEDSGDMVYADQRVLLHPQRGLVRDILEEIPF